ncbi:G8 domain-containing protein [Nitrosomonas aestuarii]|uniref:G8 domain-containing protein n=1 Tax=Nitrosomonas aestuarii TaxID=52441 RepID=A0A1I4G3D4_9PROT|nr:G8 domain-containing protein [Nitrosomonas aestuarii]SFL23757.1 G8 domain-containing protein [Nitrosomonas aestuarii]
MFRNYLSVIVLFAAFFCTQVFATEPASFTTPTDTIPNYAKNPTVISAQSGNWFDASTWDTNTVPTTDDVVKIDPGHTVTYNGTSNDELAALGIEGDLEFKYDINTKLAVGTIIVYRDGRLQIGTVTNPIDASKTAEIVFSDITLPTTTADPITGVLDPSQYGSGLIVLGEIVVYGADKGPSFVRFTDEPLKNYYIFGVDQDVSNWSAGDNLIIPDSRQLQLKRKWTTYPIEYAVMQDEEVTLSSTGTNSITLSANLVYDHPAARHHDNTVYKMPHIGNLTRNVIFRSENPEGTRAHGMVTERAWMDINNALFKDMGRTTADVLDSTTYDEYGAVTHVGTNQIGRYPLHAHHLMGPVNASNTGYQSRLTGTAFDDCEKWCMSHHNSHWALVQNNVFAKATGSSYMHEDGNETGIEILDNFAVVAGAPMLNWYLPRYGGVTSHEEKDMLEYFGYEGSGFWFTGNDQIFKGNIAAQMAFAGWMNNPRSPSQFSYHKPTKPNFRGADINTPADWTEYTDPWAPSIPAGGYDGNETYGSAVGFWIGFAGSVGEVKNQDSWHIHQQGMYLQRSVSAKLTNLKFVNDQTISYNSYYDVLGLDIENNQYHAAQMHFENLHIEGFFVGVKNPSSQQNDDSQMGGVTPIRLTYYQDGYLRNYINVREHSPIMNEKWTLFENFEFELPGLADKWGKYPSADVIPSISGSFTRTRLTANSRLYFRGHNGTSGNDFEFFYREQASSYVMPDRYPLTLTTPKYANDSCPTSGYTNQQCMDTHSVATMNKIATCSDDTTRPTFDGFTCTPTGETELDAWVNMY